MNVSWTQRPGRRAFTLLEVMVAIAIFFAAVVAVLELVSQNLRLVQLYQQARPSPSDIASEIALGTTLQEGGESGDFSEFYPGSTWAQEVTMVGTNGLYRVDLTVTELLGEKTIENKMSVLFYRPETAPR
jgi:prepilin-type N-terminal cleavage/methylation domain-containing protein